MELPDADVVPDGDAVPDADAELEVELEHAKKVGKLIDHR